MGIITVFKRKEIKYLITDKQYYMLMDGVLNERMVQDDFAVSHISNVYYDTPSYLLIRRSLDKPDYKEKLRLRSYETPVYDSRVFLEVKKKFDGIVYKRRETMGYEEAVDYLSQRKGGGEGQIFSEIDWMLRFYGNLKPAMFIYYDRYSLKGKDDPSIRITFDSNIVWRNEEPELSKGVWGSPLLEEGRRLMEIKISGAMPMWLAEGLSEIGIFPTSFSKYGTAYRQMLADEKKERMIKYA